MVLDGPKDDDKIYPNDGVTFIINEELLKSVSPVSVDYIETERGGGYRIDSSLNSCTGCGNSCSC